MTDEQTFKTDATLHAPFEILIGNWQGLAKNFDLDGNFAGAAAAQLLVSWKSADEILLQEEIIPEAGGEKTSFDIVLKVSGKTFTGENDYVTVSGVQLTPNNFIVNVHSKNDGTTVYNDHYFFDFYTRRIITQTAAKDGEVLGYDVQDFVKVGSV